MKRKGGELNKDSCTNQADASGEDDEPKKKTKNWKGASKNDDGSYDSGRGIVHNGKRVYDSKNGVTWYEHVSD